MITFRNSFCANTLDSTNTDPLACKIILIVFNLGLNLDALDKTIENAFVYCVPTRPFFQSQVNEFWREVGRTSPRRLSGKQPSAHHLLPTLECNRRPDGAMRLEHLQPSPAPCCRQKEGAEKGMDTRLCHMVFAVCGEVGA